MSFKSCSEDNFPDDWKAELGLLRKPLLFYALILTKDFNEAEELVSQVTLMLIEKQKKLSFNSSKQLLAYANKAIKSRFLNTRSRRSTFQGVWGSLTRLWKPEVPLDSCHLPLEMRLLVEKLPDLQAEALILQCLHGYTLKEIADYQGCTLETVASRIRYAKSKLVKLLEEEETHDPSS